MTKKIINDIFWIKPLISKQKAEKYLLKKNVETVNLELVFLHFKIYKYTAQLKRLFVKPKPVTQFMMLNPFNKKFAPIQIDISELEKGLPDGKKIKKEINYKEYEEKAEQKMLFFILKRYFILQTPTISCDKKLDIYFPYWQFKKNKFLNARRKVIEEIKVN